MNTLAVILSGGGSRRMGRDKALLPFRGGTLLSHLVEVYAPAFDSVAVSVDRPGRFPLAGALELTDLYSGQGPLAGLHAAFTRTDAQIVFLTAVDFPYGTAESALALADALAGHDACLIRTYNSHGSSEPAYAAYHRRILPRLTDCLEAGKLSFQRDLLDLCDTLYLDPPQLPAHDWDRIFFNVNRPEDYETLLQMEARESKA